MKRYFAMIKRAWKKGNIFDCFCYILPPFAILLLMLLFAVWIIVRVSQLIFTNIDSILGFGILLLGIYIYLRKFPKQTSAVSTQENYIFEETEDKVHQSLSTNYEIIGNVIYKIIRQYYALLKLKKPERQEDIESMTRTKCKGKIVLYEYILYKTGDYETKTIKLLLEQFIKNKVKNGDLEGFSEGYYLYEGVTMPILQIDEIEDCIGYYKLYVTLANKHYCDYISNTINTNLVSGVERIHYDSDF